MAKIRCFVIGFLSFFWLSQTVLSQLAWTPYTGNPVIDPDFDSESIIIHRPVVMFDGFQYHMWYANTRPVSHGFITLNQSYMGYATSPDGFNWTLANPTAVSPSADQNAFDQFHASQGWVIADQDTFKMWYWGFNNSAGPYGLNSIGYAWSIDGSSWQSVAGPGAMGSVYDLEMAGLPDTLGLATPCVVKDTDGYHMWYSQVVIAPFIFRIGYACSQDGIHWSRVDGDGPNGAVLDWGPPGNFDQVSVAWPAVMKTEQGFLMWYYGHDGITGRLGHAVSEDGIHWTRVAGTGQGGSCFETAHAVSVIQIDNQYKMWYVTFDQDIVNLAFSESSTGLVETAVMPLPLQFLLKQNCPNPFNPWTEIGFTIPYDTFVTLKVYNLLGIEVADLLQKQLTAGNYTVRVDASVLPGGLYFYRLQTSGVVLSKKMILLK
jgi:hypothetical protein